MARGNRGRGLMHYANALYDFGHEGVLALHAHGDLLGALVAADAHPEFGDRSVPPMFANAAASIGRAYDLEAIEVNYDADSPSFEEAGEADYRHWCLDHRLFLNPLNDVLVRPIAATDVLGLPKALAELRNHLEHKYVKVHEMGPPRPIKDSDHKDPFVDNLAYVIMRSDLERKALRILKLARSAIVYLSLAIHRAEQQRAAKAGKETLKISMILDVIPDDWKTLTQHPPTQSSRCAAGPY